MRNVLLVWLVGLTLGIAAGAATAMLLLPKAAHGSNTGTDIGRLTVDRSEQG